MSVLHFLDRLAAQGIEVWADQDKLKVQSPRGALSGDLCTELAERKAEILAFLQGNEGDAAGSGTACEPSLRTIGRLLAGLASGSKSDFKAPIIDPGVMASRLTVTFQPLPAEVGDLDPQVVHFREALEAKLRQLGVRIEPWEQATRKSTFTFRHPLTEEEIPVQTQVVRAGINAVVRVEAPETPHTRQKAEEAEALYELCRRTVWNDQKPSAARISQFIGWAEQNIRSLEDPTNTQTITLAPLDPALSDAAIPYCQKIPIGVGTLVKNFSEIVIGVSPSRLSILNMNLSDTSFPITELDHFVRNSLVPKLYVPILPLSISRFLIGEYDPAGSPYVPALVELGRALRPMGLLPSGFQIDTVIPRRSHRDIIDWMVSGRTGVSYGFIAYLEPPQYVGDIEVSAREWEGFLPVAGFDATELRRNSLGRRYVPVRRGGELVYRQLPDVWLVCSRSGSDKTNLDSVTDVLRVGLTERLHLELPRGLDLAAADIKPSYDIYVMVAIALAGALYLPSLMDAGSSVVHFHGYPAADWFDREAGEYCTGVRNPSVPCGTYESGVFNFLGIRDLAACPPDREPTLISLVEPDHGVNIVARDPAHLLGRLEAGVRAGVVELGGRHFPTLKRAAAQSLQNE